MMRRIADEMQRKTAAFKIREPTAGTDREVGEQKHILDCCMAPGTYLQVALEHNPGAHALAFTLPPAVGGHSLILAEDEARGLVIKLLDVTMLAGDMGVTPDQVPQRHPDAAAFLPPQVAPGRQFDLVLCDGQVLRTHQPHRAAYRDGLREPRRLLLTQLILGLEHVRPGGTMIVLLHKVEGLNTICLLRAFRRFSSLRLFKPTSGHTKRSSFYMIATEIQAGTPAAAATVDQWKEEWRIVTFASDAEYQEAKNSTFPNGAQDVDELLHDFGSELIRLGHDVWKIQADALAKAPFNRF